MARESNTHDIVSDFNARRGTGIDPEMVEAWERRILDAFGDATKTLEMTLRSRAGMAPSEMVWQLALNCLEKKGMIGIAGMMIYRKAA